MPTYLLSILVGVITFLEIDILLLCRNNLNEKFKPSIPNY